MASRTVTARTDAARAKAPTRKRLNVRRCSVTFRFHAPEAKCVDVAGSFNNWELRGLKKGKDGTWKTNIRPLPGRYEYKFLVDHQWVADPENSHRSTDEHGNENSVIELE